MKIFSAKNPPEAHIVCELLKLEGIQSEVRGEGLFGLQGELPFGEDSSPYIWLLDLEKKELATSVIDEYEHQHSDVGKDAWICTKCEESNEGQFALCWNCQEQSPR